jgi:hypothetical protein
MEYELTDYPRSATSRDSSKADGIKTIIADLDSLSLSSIVSEFDIVLHAANADHLNGVTGIIERLERRAQRSSRKPILIHTSGAGVLMCTSPSDGRVRTDKTFDDNDLHAYHALPDDAIHKNVDNVVLEAGRRGNILAIVVAPPVVWGTGKRVFNQHSMVRYSTSDPGICSFYM